MPCTTCDASSREKCARRRISAGCRLLSTAQGHPLQPGSSSMMGLGIWVCSGPCRFASKAGLRRAWPPAGGRRTRKRDSKTVELNAALALGNIPRSSVISPPPCCSPRRPGHASSPTLRHGMLASSPSCRGKYCSRSCGHAKRRAKKVGTVSECDSIRGNP